MGESIHSPQKTFEAVFPEARLSLEGFHIDSRHKKGDCSFSRVKRVSRRKFDHPRRELSPCQLFISEVSIQICAVLSPSVPTCLCQVLDSDARSFCHPASSHPFRPPPDWEREGAPATRGPGQTWTTDGS